MKQLSNFVLLLTIGLIGFVNIAMGQNCVGSLTLALQGATSNAPLSINNVSLQNVSCNGGNDGAINLSVVGGSPNYTYSWADNSIINSALRTGLAAGTYEVFVTDQHGCLKNQSFTITEPTAIVATATASNLTICNGSSTMLQASATGGISPTYDFVWDNGIGNTNGTNPIVFPTNTTTYTVSIADTNGCVATASVTIQVSNSSNSGTAAIPLTVCTMDNNPIALNSLLSGADAGGVWTSVSPVVGFDANAATFIPLGNAQGLYDFVYTVGSAPCLPQSTTVSVILDNQFCPIRPTLGDYLASPMGTGSIGTCLLVSGNQWIDVFDNQGNIVFSINPNGNDLGETCWGVRVENNAQPRQINSMLNGNLYSSYFVDRNIYITPTNQPQTPVSIKLYVLDAEMQRFTSALSVNNTNLGITRFDGTVTSPSDLNIYNNVTANVPMSSVAAYLPQTPATFRTDWALEYGTDHFSEFLPGYSSSSQPGVFPVVLLHFTGRQMGSSDLLTWQTSSELNSSVFEVEHSLDGVTFSKIGEVAAAGTSTTLKNYQFTNEKVVSEKNFYRLRMVDINGAFQYSNIINLNHSKVTVCSVFPNPVKDVLNVKIDGIIDRKTTFELYNPEGKAVVSETWKIDGNTIRQIDITRLANGVYLYFITNHEGVFSGKVMIQH